MYKNFYNFNLTTLIKIRLHLGHHNKSLNKYLNAYIYGTRHNVNIYDLDKFWKPYRYLFYTLIQNFFFRNTFFIIGTNKNLPMSLLLEDLLTEHSLEIKKQLSFYISGYVDRKWIGGLFSNWKIFSEFIQYLDRSSLNFKKKYRFQKYLLYLKGIKNFQKMPIPDFVVFLDQNEDALYELKKMQIPFIGLVDTNMNPNDFLYKFFGNNDSIKNIEFFFEFLQAAIKEGRLKEQQAFYFYFVFKLKKILNFNSK